MRRFILFAPLFAAACATAPAPPIHGEVPGRICHITNADQFIGQPGTSETGASILRATNSAILRWAPVGYMLTMDYSASRVTVRLGPDRRVTAVSCG